VLFLADTNNDGKPTHEFLMKLTGSGGVSTDKAGKIQDAYGGALKTCCHDDNYKHEYDRIGMSGQHVTLNERKLVFDDPKWAHIITTGKAGKVVKGQFHKAVFASFDLPTCQTPFDDWAQKFSKSYGSALERTNAQKNYTENCERSSSITKQEHPPGRWV